MLCTVYTALRGLKSSRFVFNCTVFIVLHVYPLPCFVSLLFDVPLPHHTTCTPFHASATAASSNPCASAIACRSFSPKGRVSRVGQRVTVAVPLHMAGDNVDDFCHLVSEGDLVGNEPVPRMAAVFLRNGV